MRQIIRFSDGQVHSVDRISLHDSPGTTTSLDVEFSKDPGYFDENSLYALLTAITAGPFFEVILGDQMWKGMSLSHSVIATVDKISIRIAIYPTENAKVEARISEVPHRLRYIRKILDKGIENVSETKDFETSFAGKKAV